MALADARNMRERENTLDDAPEARRGRADLPFTLLVLILLSIGVVMVLSASFASAYYESGDPTYFFRRQLGFAVGGVVAMYLFSRISMKIYRNFSMLLLVVSIALLFAVLFFGETRNYAKRWFNLGFTQFQPSEITKVAIIMSFSVMICKYGDGLRRFKLSN